MKTIDTLSEDIYHVLDPTQDHEACVVLSEDVAKRIAEELTKATEKRDKPREHGKLWASDIGKKCLRQHHYNFNNPELGEKIDGHTKFKFLYGNILEEAVLHYATEAQHTVSHTQGQVETSIDGWTVRGRIDAVIDGVLVDVKSTSSFGYKRYKDGIDSSNDSFGYLEQLGFYREFGGWDTSRAGFVWIDKQNGHIKYTDAATPSKEALEDRVRDIIKSVDSDETDVARAYSPEAYGKSGNQKLSIGCSYCPFKQHCWRDANGGQGLRGFVYSHGPVWFTDVVREPNKSVPEIPNDQSE